VQRHTRAFGPPVDLVEEISIEVGIRHALECGPSTRELVACALPLSQAVSHELLGKGALVGRQPPRASSERFEDAPRCHVELENFAAPLIHRNREVGQCTEGKLGCETIARSRDPIRPLTGGGLRAATPSWRAHAPLALPRTRLLGTRRAFRGGHDSRQEYT
jgi:hypothetical protein